MFQSHLFNQLRSLINQEIRVAVGEVLYRGRLLSVDNNVLRLVDSTDDYERESRNVIIPLAELSFIQVNTNLG